MRSGQMAAKPHAGAVRILLVMLITLAGGILLGQENEAAGRVVVLANADDSESRRIAEYYATKRGIPADNIIALSLPKAETISWREFVVGVWQPLQDELIRRGWIDAIPMKLIDEAGRRKVAPSGHRMSYLVVCRGVPLRINHDTALYDVTPGKTERPEFQINRSAVDAELSLLAHGPYPINGYVSNPLFRVKQPSDLLAGTVVKVARLDGPAASDVIAMIDGAIEAEANGLIGRTYVDVRGPHAQGNNWMESVIKALTAADFAPDTHRGTGTFPDTARMDAPAVYMGWYAGNVNGPFGLPGFRFAPGAIAVHIHSYSAQTLRSDSKAWCGPFIARGAAATTGAVFEPYLQMMHHLDLLTEALLRGESLGDAAYYALPVLSWQNVLLGDPLYRPFRRDLDWQLKHRDALPPLLGTYVVLRELHRLRAAGKADAAEKLARREMRERPSLPLGVALGRMLLDRGDRDGAALTLGFASHLRTMKAAEWALLQQAAAMLIEAGATEPALQTYETLLVQAGMPDNLRMTWMKLAAKTAAAANDLTRAVRWEQEAAGLSGEQAQK